MYDPKRKLTFDVKAKSLKCKVGNFFAFGKKRKRTALISEYLIFVMFYPKRTEAINLLLTN